MKKITVVAAAMLAAALFSASASAVPGGSAMGLKAPDATVKVAYCHVRHHHRRCCATRVYYGCGCYGCGCGGHGWAFWPFFW